MNRSLLLGCLVLVPLLGCASAPSSSAPGSARTSSPLPPSHAPAHSASSAEIAGAPGVTPMPSLERLLGSLDSKDVAACRDADSKACWRIGNVLWELPSLPDDAAAAVLLRRTCELSFGLTTCWVAARLMRTRVFEPHDRPEPVAAASLLARVCDAAVDRRDAPGSHMREHYVEYVCIDAARALKDAGDARWTAYAARGCEGLESGCILGADALDLRERYRWLADRCEGSIPASRGGKAAETHTDGKLFRFDDCYAAAALYEANTSTLEPRTLTTIRGLANAMIQAEDADLGQNSQLARIPASLLPKLPKSYGAPGSPSAGMSPTDYLSLQKLRWCIVGTDHDLCSEVWDWDGGTLLQEPAIDADLRCLQAAPNGYASIGGVPCGYVAQSLMRGVTNPLQANASRALISALGFARRACWLDDWTCDVYARALQLTGGASNKISFEYKRACAAGNARACTATAPATGEAR